MTIRSSSKDDPMTPASNSRPNQDDSLSRRGSVTEPRQRRSAIYEQQRSESRLGRRTEEGRSASRLGREEEEEEDKNIRSPSSANLNSSPPKRRERTSTVSTTGGDSTTTDTSGTEGAGSVSGGRRRRKKSSASSRGKGPSRKGRSSPSSRQTEDWARDTAVSSKGWPSHSRMESDADDGLNGIQGSSRRRNQPNGTSPGANSSLQAFPSQRSPQRSGLPQDFRQPSSASASTSRYRSDSMYDDQDDEGQGSGFPRNTEAGYPSGIPPRRRHASDAQPAQIPNFEYQGRGGTKDSRLSVDSGAATRHLMRASSNGPDTLPTSRSQEWGDLMSSPSEDARVRKVSLASSNSNSNSRSSGGHSDRFRSSSRLSSRDSDVFGDGRDGYGRGSPAPGDLGYKMERVESKQRRLAALETGGSRRGVRRADYEEVSWTGIERLVFCFLLLVDIVRLRLLPPAASIRNRAAAARRFLRHGFQESKSFFSAEVIDEFSVFRLSLSKSTFYRTSSPETHCHLF